MPHSRTFSRSPPRSVGVSPWIAAVGYGAGPAAKGGDGASVASSKRAAVKGAKVPRSRVLAVRGSCQIKSLMTQRASVMHMAQLRRVIKSIMLVARPPTQIVPKPGDKKKKDDTPKWQPAAYELVMGALERHLLSLVTGGQAIMEAAKRTTLSGEHIRIAAEIKGLHRGALTAEDTYKEEKDLLRRGKFEDADKVRDAAEEARARITASQDLPVTKHLINQLITKGVVSRICNLAGLQRHQHQPLIQVLSLAAVDFLVKLVKKVVGALAASDNKMINVAMVQWALDSLGFSALGFGGLTASLVQRSQRVRQQKDAAAREKAKAGGAPMETSPPS